jgi:2-hydroxychromene-2-carboxylate isomerase
MTQASPIDFWFSIGSLYTYLAVMRLAEVEARTGAVFRWRPFSIRAIMIEMDNIRAKQPVKLAYSWRDVERRAQEYGFAFRPRPPYPLKNFDLANRIAVVGAAEAGVPITRGRPIGVGFLDHEEAGSDRSNAQCLDEIGQDARRVIERAASEETTRAYETATAEARSLGIFGVPTFATRGEIFWGDDRLETAIRWHQG